MFWRQTRDADIPDNFLPAVVHRVGSNWTAISWKSLGLIIPKHDRVTANDYDAIFGDQLHPMIQTLFPDGGAIFQDDNAPIHSESEGKHLSQLAQSPELNRIEPLWSILENKPRADFFPQSTSNNLKLF